MSLICISSGILGYVQSTIIYLTKHTYTTAIFLYLCYILFPHSLLLDILIIVLFTTFYHHCRHIRPIYYPVPVPSLLASISGHTISYSFSHPIQSSTSGISALLPFTSDWLSNGTILIEEQ